MADLNRRGRSWARRSSACTSTRRGRSRSTTPSGARGGASTERRISVSKYLAARFSDDDIHQTLLHEVAHALAGAAAGHGPAWKRVARELGYAGSATHALETATELAPWVGTCPNGHLVYRHRRPSRPSSCVKCARGFDRRFLFTWHRREITRADRLAAATPR